MAQLKSPRLKKQDSYEKDHRTEMENPHAFRKNWPKKKARENRRDRVALRSVLAEVDVSEVTAKGIKHLRDKSPIRKSFVTNLKVSIEKKQARSSR
jgi:hypothetical protein